MTRDSTPVLGKASFTCPHCGAIAHQSWLRVYAKWYDKDGAPYIPDEDLVTRVFRDNQPDQQTVARAARWVRQMRGGLVFADSTDSTYVSLEINNLWISKCFSCSNFARPTGRHQGRLQ
jgi:hypothetical protein